MYVYICTCVYSYINVPVCLYVQVSQSFIAVKRYYNYSNSYKETLNWVWLTVSEV